MPATAEAADAATQATDAFSTKLEENKLPEGQERGPEEEEDDDDDETPAPGDAEKKKKKKKKSGAKKKKSKTAKAVMEQTEPPSIGLTKMFPNGVFPVGEVQQYDETKFDESRKRVTGEELRERERLIQEKDLSLIHI
mgnify:FL=1